MGTMIDMPSGELLQIALEFSTAGWMAQLAQSLAFNLPYSLSRHIELSTYFFQGSGASVSESEPELQHLLLALGKSI
jgi:hypothetical protein